MYQASVSSHTSRTSTPLTRRDRIVRAGLVSVFCAVLGAGFIAGPHASATHNAASATASHMIAQTGTSDTVGGPGTM